MQIVTNSGKTYEADWVLDTQTRHGIQQLTIQLPGNNDPSEIIRNLVGYEGYTMFYSLIATPDRNGMRLTLEKGV